MKLIFTKGAGKSDLMEIHRPGMAVEQVDCPKQGIIPHDMVHYAIEHTLHKRGFLGRIKNGEAAIFQMTAEAESDAVEHLVEVFQGDAWSGGQGTASELIDMYAVTCAARDCPALPLDGSAITAIRAAIADLTQRWADVAIGGSLVLLL
jgi:hypothetical protein